MPAKEFTRCVTHITPKPNPKPNPKPKANPNPKPKLNPKPNPKLNPKVKPKPKPKPNPQLKPIPNPKPNRNQCVIGRRWDGVRDASKLGPRSLTTTKNIHTYIQTYINMQGYRGNIRTYKHI